MLTAGSHTAHKSIAPCLVPADVAVLTSGRVMKLKRITSIATVCGAIVATLAVTAGNVSAAVAVRGTFTPVDPVRILDTRDGTGVADQHRGPLRGFVTVYPCGNARPLASNLNFIAGVNAANQVTAKVGRDGRVCLFTSAQTQLVADVSGWYADDFASVPGFWYHPLTAARIVDTRDGTGLGDRAVAPLAAGEVLAVTVPGAGGVPADDDVRAVTMNVTVADAVSAGYITVFPCDLPRPGVSNVNFDPANPTVSNLATVRPSSTGQVCFFASVSTNLIVDVQGYFSPRADVTFTSVGPVRILDTRDGTGVVGSRVSRPARGTVIELQVAGENGVPLDASAVLLNVTITEASGPGFVTAWPCGRPRPLASFLNFVRGVDRANLTPVRIGSDGKVCLYVHEGTQVIADLNGYYTTVAT
ncbi:MAG: alpha-tubulin suppressor-like protein [Acidimicrobiaceae bacterium]|nr:MAG: alpha-tubulin suppressor-like protein [Acidimicrobiaceae bacterium]